MDCIKQFKVKPGKGGIAIPLRQLEKEFSDKKHMTCLLGAFKAISMSCDKNFAVVKVSFKTRDGDEIVLIDGEKQSVNDQQVVLTCDHHGAVETVPFNTESTPIENQIKELVEYPDTDLVMYLHKFMNGVDLKTSEYMRIVKGGSEIDRRTGAYRHAMLRQNEQKKLVSDPESVVPLNLLESHPVHYVLKTENASLHGTNTYVVTEKEVYDVMNRQNIVEAILMVDKYMDLELVIETDTCSTERILTVNFKGCPCVRRGESQVVQTVVVAKTPDEQIAELAQKFSEQLSAIKGESRDVEEVETLRLVEEEDDETE